MTALETTLAPVDRIRRELLRGIAAFTGPAIADRELRVGVLAAGAVLGALALTCVVPIWLLALGPVVLGVPHLLADVRYLVVRRGLDRRLGAQLAIGLPLLAVTLWPHVWVGLAAAAGGLVAARGSVVRRLGGLAVVAGLGVAAHAWIGRADLLFAHLHNLIAVALFLVWRPPSWPRVAAVLLFLVAGAAILAGAADSALMAAARWNGADLGLGPFLAFIAPSSGPGFSVHLMLFFAFAQSVHYAIWLRLIPELDRDRPAPRTFRNSLAALRAELGDAWLWGFALAAVVISAWAVFQIGAARDGYLRLAIFHGHLELGAIALLWAERRRLVGP